MAKKTYEEYLADAHITPEPKSDFRKDMDKYAPAIKAGMEAAKKRNKELLDKRNASESEGKAPKTHRTIEEESMKPASHDATTQSTQTEVKASKGGYVEAETREKPKVKRRTTTTLAPHGAAATKGTPSTVSTTTSTRGQSGSTGGANALAPHGAASTKGTSPPKKGYAPENQDVNKIDNSAAKTMIYNDSVKLKVKSKRPKSTGLKPSKLTISSLRNEYQQELMKKHKKELSK